MTNKAKGFENKCTGCSVCYAVCPVNAVSIEINEKGFFSAKPNQNCIECGKCSFVCPLDTNWEKIDYQQAEMYSAYQKMGG